MRPVQAVPTTGVRLRLVALPTEHGGWGFLLEPIVLGLALAPSLAGLLLGLAAIGIFLTRHPLTLALGDWRRGKRYPRTAWAERFVLLYGLTALAASVAALAIARPFWQALLLAAPLALIQLGFDLRRESRGLVPEVAGAWALSASAPAIMLAAGASLGPALAIWAVLAARAAASILYVRARLRRLRGASAPAGPVVAAHLAGIAAVVALAAAELAPWLAVLALALLLARALHGLSPRRPPVRAVAIGVREVGYGVMTVVLTALGALLGL
jgi:hypothetical protein